MENRRTTCIAIAAALALPLVATARDLTLAGSTAAKWNLIEETWSENGSPTTFQQGDDVLVDDTFTGPSLTFDGRVTPGDVVFDINRNLTLDFGSARRRIRLASSRQTS